MKKNLLLPIILLIGCFSAFSQPYQARLAAFRADYLKDLGGPQSPITKDDLKDVHFFEADSTYNVTASVEILSNEKPFMMPSFSGEGKQFIRYARLNFTLHGRDLKLTLYKNIPAPGSTIPQEYLFLPFTDQTNSKETYGGGRYIDYTAADIKDGRLNLDFNKAYNPYCAYSTGYRCPVPPQENDLDLKIIAGEKMFTGEKKHR